MARWRRGDTEAFNAVMSAGDKARAMYEKYQAGQAFRDASQVTEQGGLGTQAQLDASRAEADALSAQDAETFGITPEESASGQYAQQAATSNKQYGLGKNPTSFRSTAYTPEEQAAAGYRGQQTYYAASGDTEKALDLGLKSKAIEAAALQQELTKGQLARQPLELEALTRAATRDKTELAREQTRDSTIKTFSAAREAALQGDYGPLQKIVGRQYNNQLPGLDDGNTIQFLDGGGVVKFDPRTKQGFTAPLNEKTATQLLDEGLSKRLAAISSKDWMAEREFMFRQGKEESEADFKKRTADAADRKNARELKQDRMEWGEVDADGKRVPGSGWRGEYLTAMQNKGATGGRGNVQEVTWKDDTGAVRTGRVGLEMIGRRLVAYDIATGKDLPTEDPRYQAILNGVPKNSKNDPEPNPEIVNIQAKIKKGEATAEDFARFKGLVKLDSLRVAFDTEASKDRIGAVTGLFTKGVFGPGGMAESPAAQNEIAATLGITRAELDMARLFARKKAVQNIPRRFQQAPSEAAPRGLSSIDAP